MNHRNSTRRKFLKSSAALGAGASMFAAPAIAQNRAGAGERIRVAVVGVRGRGRNHIGSLHELAGENVEIAAVCDVDQKVLNAVADSVEKRTGKKVARFIDYQEMLEEKSIDAVSLGTPDHWHALQTIWACQAGKDVYCEKVASHNIAEGRKMVRAARRYGRIVQHGTQARSSPNVQEGIRKLHEGLIGRLYMGRAIAYKFLAGGRSKIGPPPPGLDWNRWQGPAEKTPYDELIHRRWRFVKDYGNGQIGAQGVHQLDMLRWGMKLDAHPGRIQAMGGNLLRDTSDENTGGEMAAAFMFEDRNIMVTFETRTGCTNSEEGMGVKYLWCDHRNVVGAIFFGTEGYMIFPDFSSYHTFLGRQRKPGPSALKEGAPMMNTEHFQNWIVAVRSRNPRDLTAEIEEGHLSSSMCQLANAAYETGRTLRFDSENERFIDDQEADRLLTRPYRKPFVVPDEV
jgi:predicted dehydrogenase